MLRNRRAFTLIELLVVIAIIAILAAILFPVFAQAKAAAKKTAAIAQSKQLGTGIQLYLADSEDNYPLALVPDAFTGGERYYQSSAGGPYPALYPAEDIPALDFDVREDGAFWINSTQPYIKNLQLAEVQGMFEVNAWVATVYNTRKKANAKSNLQMNGFLHAYNASAVASPSVLPMLWQAFGTQQLLGGSVSNPFLNCDGVGPCRYNPSGPVQPGQRNAFNSDIYSPLTGRGTHYVFGRSLIFIAADTSARTKPVGGAAGVTAPQNSFKFDPFRLYSAAGIGTRPYYCGALSYECTFQPDREF
ncbi:MAG: prepilin-type N-terminal cleavage/methylation domain-containing protein [Chthonomonas sp.]|nr:prepilin-type N-terminal cleavage/methylation domain-containing protein [Chthonomonas sp.]